jgi:hypothetical protein
VINAVLQSTRIMGNLVGMRHRWIGVVLAGLAASACETPVCGPGFVEVDGRCVADSSVVVECSEPCNLGAHEWCNPELEEPACECAPGYDGVPCEWVGVLNDPGFADKDAWTGINDAEVRELVDGPSGDPGLAILPPSAVCNGGALSQTVDMPPLESAEPLVAVLSYKAEEAHGISVGFNRAWNTFPMPTGDWQTARFCLGEAAYGTDVVVRVGSSEKTGDCKLPEPIEARIEIDRLDIIVDERGECPLPGEVSNGDADPASEGWRFDGGARTQMQTSSRESGAKVRAGHASSPPGGHSPIPPR